MFTESVETHVYRIVAELFDQPLEKITPDSSPQTIEGWDSLGHLNLALALEQEFGVTFSQKQMDEMTDVRKIVNLVSRANQRNSHD